MIVMLSETKHLYPYNRFLAWGTHKTIFVSFSHMNAYFSNRVTFLLCPLKKPPKGVTVNSPGRETWEKKEKKKIALEGRKQISLLPPFQG